MKRLFGKHIHITVVLLLTLSGIFDQCANADGSPAVNDPLEKGKYYLSVNQHQKALDEFEAVLMTTEGGPIREEALYKKGFTLLLMRRDREALGSLKLYLERYPNGKYASEISLMYRGFKAEEEYRAGWSGKLLENSLIGPSLAIGFIMIWIYVLLDLKKTNLPVRDKSIWVILIVFMPPFGVVIYYWAKHYRKFSSSW